MTKHISSLKILNSDEAKSSLKILRRTFLWQNWYSSLKVTYSDKKSFIAVGIAGILSALRPFVTKLEVVTKVAYSDEINFVPKSVNVKSPFSLYFSEPCFVFLLSTVSSCHCADTRSAIALHVTTAIELRCTPPRHCCWAPLHSTSPSPLSSVALC